MTEVISYRTDEFERLRELAKVRKTSISTLTSSIIERYLNYFQSIEERKFIAMPREMLSLLYESLDQSKFSKISEIALRGAIKDLKFIFEKPTLDNISDYIQVWFDNNGFVLRRTMSDASIRFVCKHDMGKNWSKISLDILLGIYDKFGFQCDIEDLADDYFAFKVSKNK